MRSLRILEGFSLQAPRPPALTLTRIELIMREAMVGGDGPWGTPYRHSG
jgi:hypothetical protein